MPLKKHPPKEPRPASNVGEEVFFYAGTALGTVVFVALVLGTQMGLAQSRAAALPLQAAAILGAPLPRESASIEAVLTPPLYPQRDFGVAEPNVLASTALIFNLADERILFEKDIHTPKKIASLTKILTGLAVLENLNLNSKVTLTPEAVATFGQAGNFDAGETFLVRDLLTAMLVQSSNDAAQALADAAPQSILDFINKLILDLGLEKTSIATVTGLDDADNHATAFDLMRLILYSSDQRELWRLMGLPQATIYEVKNQTPHELFSTNKLLGKFGVIAGKTGFTTEAKETYVAIFQIAPDQRLGLVILDSPDRFTDTQTLINWANRAYQW